jgi:small subunit ribosomal protein S7
MAEIKVFGLWSTGDIKVADPGLAGVLSLRPVLVPRTGARYARQRFYKSKASIVERLINKVMIPGHKGKKHKISSSTVAGKGTQAYALVKNAFILIEQRVKKNPVGVFVQAVENAAPREELVTIEYGGARYPKAVDCAPQRRIDVALRHMVQGSFSKSFNSKKKASETLAEEIVNAANLSPNSNAVSRKLDTERQADASR